MYFIFEINIDRITWKLAKYLKVRTGHANCPVIPRHTWITCPSYPNTPVTLIICNIYRYCLPPILTCNIRFLNIEPGSLQLSSSLWTAILWVISDPYVYQSLIININYMTTRVRRCQNFLAPCSPSWLQSTSGRLKTVLCVTVDSPKAGQ